LPARTPPEPDGKQDGADEHAAAGSRDAEAQMARLDSER